MLINQLYTLTLLALLNNSSTGISTIPPLPKISSKDTVSSLASLHPITGNFFLNEYHMHLLYVVIKVWFMMEFVFFMQSKRQSVL